MLSAHLAGTGGDHHARGGPARRRELVPGADPAAGRGLLVRAGDPRPVRRSCPQGHPRLEPLILPLHDDQQPRPRPGTPGPDRPGSGPTSIRCRVTSSGPGLFTIPHGPVRSGVMESIEYLVETPGEDIPHLNMRVFYKHRGIEKRFEGMTAGRRRAARRAHRRCGVGRARPRLLPRASSRSPVREVPWPAALVRVLHAELERIASHLDVAVRLADAAGPRGRHRPVRAAQGAGAAAGQPHVREQVRPRRGGPRRGQRAAAGQRPRDFLARDRPAGARRSPPTRGS